MSNPFVLAEDLHDIYLQYLNSPFAVRYNDLTQERRDLLLDDGRLDAPSTVNRRRRIRYLDGVAVLMGGADLLHTHESWPMDRLLDEIEAPDLVLGDHGWAGAAIMRGIEVVCFTDVNDPAIAVAKADGLVDIVVPCDDNLPPASYDPVRDYLLGRLT